MIYGRLILFINFIVLLFCVSSAEITKFSVPAVVNDIGIRPGETLLDYLPKNEVQEIKKLLPHIKKCFYSETFFTNSEDHIFNVELRRIIPDYFVSFFCFHLCSRFLIYFFEI